MDGARKAVSCFAVEWDGIGIVPMPSIKVTYSGWQYNLLYSSQDSALKVLVGAETEKEPWTDMFSWEERRAEVVGNVPESGGSFGHLKELLSDA